MARIDSFIHRKCYLYAPKYSENRLVHLICKMYTKEQKIFLRFFW